jgi:hypothetical protein
MPRPTKEQEITRACKKHDQTQDEVPQAIDSAVSDMEPIAIETPTRVEFAWVDPVLGSQLARIKHNVTKRDLDFVCIVDGGEGTGKSVFTFQIAKHLDPTFNIERICFNSEQFITAIKSAPKFAAIVLDEAFSAANSRASLSDVNRALIAVATEMRQKNLFIFIVIPSFFDLDRYFALWRCKALLHVYSTNSGERGRYVIFPRTSKKLLYLYGKKTYNYSFPPSPFPPCRFRHQYVIDEADYRKRKAEAFRKRTMSGRTKRYRTQRDALINHLVKFLTNTELNDIFLKSGVDPISQHTLTRVRSTAKQSVLDQEDLEEEETDESNLK